MNYKEEYKDINANLEITNKKINDLEKNDIIKRYNTLLEEKEELLILKRQTYIKMKMEEYDNCDHFWLMGLNEDICLKCGLSTTYKILNYKSDYYKLDLDNKIMYDYFKEKNTYDYLHNKGTIYHCHDNDQDIIYMYNKIKEKHPNISDKLIVYYINCVIHNKKKKRLERKKLNGFS